MARARRDHVCRVRPASGRRAAGDRVRRGALPRDVVRGRTARSFVRARHHAGDCDVRRAGPTFGQDNEYVLHEILGLTDEEVVEYIAAGALE